MLFNPDLVIFSAGFDAHSEDPLGNCWLEDEDFYWATEIVLRAMEALDLVDNVTANETREQRKAVSILEGGYDLHAISTSAVQHVRALANLTCTAVTPENAAPLTKDALYASRNTFTKDRSEEDVVKAGVKRGDEVAALQESLADLGLT